MASIFSSMKSSLSTGPIYEAALGPKPAKHTFQIQLTENAQFVFNFTVYILILIIIIIFLSQVKRKKAKWH